MTHEERTIVFLDLVRFTTLTDVHGDIAAVEVLDRFLDCVRESLEGQGSLVKSLGDGVLIEAHEPAAGVAVATRVVERFHDEDGLPDITGGLHHGSVVVRDDDVLGGAVNVASRLADAAPAGGLYATRDCARIAADAGVRVEPCGPVRLRGVLDPVDVYLVSPCDHATDETVVDPICGMRIVAGAETPQRDCAGRTFWFCAAHCLERFAANPDRYIDER